MGKKSYERRIKNGRPNPRYVDVLEVDPEIAGQAFVCVSFISPEKILKQKEHFFFEQFIKSWDFNKSMEKSIQFLNFLSFKYKLNFEDISRDFEDFVREERAELVKTTIDVDYKNFLDKEEEKLEAQFNREHDFQTSVRSVKIRGSFPSQEEAEMRARLLREKDGGAFDTLVGPVGTWLVWDPDAYKTGRVEFLEEELNQLVHEKQKNEQVAKAAFEERVREAKQKAIAENRANAEKFGNVVTQTIDEEGNLIDVGSHGDTHERALQSQGDEITIGDIQKEMFEGDDIVMASKKESQSTVSPMHIESQEEKESCNGV